MLRSLYSGISGLRADQTMLDVTGNNIANASTVGFKSSSVQFADTLSQTMSAAGSPQATKGGTNPNQVGLGVRVAAISTNLSQGSQQTTGNNLDVMIAGDGYFATRLGGEDLYTRNGSLHWDANGRLSTADGALVQGWMGVNGQVDSLAAPTGITLPRDAMAPAVATSTAHLAGNLPGDAAAGTSLVRDIQVYAADGTASTLSATFTAGAGGDWDYSISKAGGTPVTGTLHSSGGSLSPATGSSLTPTVNGITVNLGDLTSFAGVTSATIDTQNGTKAGVLLSTTMGSDGTLSGSFSNGAIMPLARLAVAVFGNPGGLEKAGNSLLRASTNSGTAAITTAGANSAGTIVAGALEMSNVDLSQEFTNLIVAQRGFQANARIITTSDEVLQELVQLKR